MAELLIALNPDQDSRLPYLLRIPQPSGDLLFRTSGTWPRVKALYCYPVGLHEWPTDAEIVEQLPLRSCQRRGAAIDVIVQRSRENRSQLVFTTARGRDAVFWQSPRTRKQARPNVHTPTARAQGIAELQIVVDAHEQYPYRFGTQQVSTVQRALPCGDYGLVVDGGLAASVERKSLADLVTSLTSGKLRYQVADLAALPRAAVVVEDRYSQLFKLDRVRPAIVADGLAELQIRWANADPQVRETLVGMIGGFYSNNPTLARDEGLRSCGLAGQTLMLAAKAMGLDSCPMVGFDFEKVSELIQLPEDHEIAFAISIGKALEPARPRGGQLPMDEVVIHDRFPSDA